MPNLEEARNKLEKLYHQLKAYAAIYHTQKICLFRPNPVGDQGTFFDDQGAQIRLVLGDNRSGKSVVGVVEAIAHSLGYRPWLEPDDPNYIVRLANGEPIPVPNKGRVIAQDFQQAIKQNIWAKLQEWAPRGWYKIRKDNRGIPVEVQWTNGSVWYLMSDAQEDMHFEGTNGHWFWVDEPCGYRKFVALQRGLVDFSGHCWMTLTPLSQPWIADMIEARAGDPDGKVKAYRFKITDNSESKGGFLPDESIDDFARNLREDEKAARLGGQWMHLTGRVYKEWEAKEPYWVPEFEIPPTWPRVRVIDPHPKKPVAVLWLAINPDNQLYAYRELFDANLRTISDVAARIKELERGEPIAMALIDSSSKEQERTSGYSVWSKFAEEGIHCAPAPKRNAQVGYDAIHEALKVQYEWHEPGLIVLNNCSNLKSNFLRFVWDEWKSSRDRDLKGEKQEVRKTDDDFIDCIRYYYQTKIDYKMLKRELQNVPEEDASMVGIFGTEVFNRPIEPDTMEDDDIWQTL